MDDAEVRRRVADAPVARLATVDPRGRPHVVPFCFVLEGDTVYSVVDDKPKISPHLKRLDNVEANPDVEVVVDHYEDDWSRLWWVRLGGRGRVLRDGDEWAHAIDLLVAKYPQYQGERRPGGRVLAIDVSRWRHWVG